MDFYYYDNYIFCIINKSVELDQINTFEKLSSISDKIEQINIQTYDFLNLVDVNHYNLDDISTLNLCSSLVISQNDLYVFFFKDANINYNQSLIAFYQNRQKQNLVS